MGNGTSDTVAKIIACAAPTAGLYTLNGQLLEKSLVDLKDEHLHARPNDQTNSIFWLYGHITATRYEVAKLLGASAEHNFKKLFSMSADHLTLADYPQLSELQESFKSITEIINERFGSVSEEEYLAESNNAFPSQDKTVSGSVLFLNFHETYHVGQIALIRKFFGYEGLVG